MEDAIKILSDVHGFDYCIIRPHNVYGPRQAYWDPYRNVVAIFINRVMKGLPPIIYGDGKQTRAFSYIDDVIPCVVKSGFENKAKSQIFNVGPLEEYSINKLAEVILSKFGSRMKPQYLPDRPNEVKHAYCSNDKAVNILGYKTNVNFEEGVSRMIDWVKLQGPQNFKYLDNLELIGSKVPKRGKKR